VSEPISYYENSEEIEKKIWSLLTTAVKDRSSEFRTPVFICGDDQDLDGRVVVLRKADQQNNFIQYHSDIRSSKIEKIKKNPKCSILFYGKEEKIQLRVKVECEVNNQNSTTEESWKKTQHISRRCYLTDNPPGTASENPTS
jgi:pyridoxamine 5'-phosphate oxidase